MKSPCQGCIERHIGCHGDCDYYYDFLRKNEIRKKNRKRQIDADRFHRESIMDAKRRKER